jgi:hypothetical protein
MHSNRPAPFTLTQEQLEEIRTLAASATAGYAAAAVHEIDESFKRHQQVINETLDEIEKRPS